MHILDENILNKKKYIGLIHKVYHSQLKNSRHFKANTKTKSEVRGGGRKPWRQKGTGNARAGSIRSSIWVGGGVSFGPKPRKIKKKINKKEKRLAIFSALLLKKSEWKILPEEIYENLQLQRKTKEVKNILENFLGEFFLKRKLLILPNQIKNLFLATRNLKNIRVILANSLNLRSILESEVLIFDEHSYKIFISYYGKSTK